MKDAGLTNTKIISDNLSDRINEIKHKAGKDILLFVPRRGHFLFEADKED